MGGKGLRCAAPGAVPGTCFKHDDLLHIATAYNRLVRSGGRGGGGGLLRGGEEYGAPVRAADKLPPERLLRELEARLGRECGAGEGAQRCWPRLAGLPPGESEELELAFVPVAPPEWKSDPDTWLSNEDIDAAIMSMTRDRDDFRYLRALSVDFDERLPGGRGCVTPVCDMRLDDISRGGRVARAAIVINLDDHRGPGTHWVALFKVLPGAPRPGFYYYDSTGKRPPARVDRFVERLGAEVAAREGGEPPEYMYNDLVHQRGNTECGVFCINFVREMLRPGATFERTCARMGQDAEMFKLRERFFVLQQGGGGGRGGGRGAARKKPARKATRKPRA